MRPIFLLPGMIALLLAATASGAPSASEILGKAKDKAAKENKAIFLDFSASW